MGIKFTGLLFSFFFFIGQISAQIDSSSNPVIGPMINILLIDSPLATEGPGGSGRYWDFTFSGIQGVNYTQQGMLPSTTPDASDFSTSTIAIFNSYHNQYQYYSTSSSALVWNGFSQQGNDLLMKFNDPGIIRQYPIILGTTNSDQYEGTGSINGYEFYRRGTVTMTCDGEGIVRDKNQNLIYPVYRLKTEWNEVDSIEQNGVFVTSVSRRVNYEFLTPGISEPIAVVEYDYNSGTSTKNFFLISKPPVSITSDLAPGPFFRVFPNPSNEMPSLLYSENSGMSRIEMFNASGKRVLDMEVTGENAPLCLPEIHPVVGAYFIKIWSDERLLATLPWIKL